MTTWDPALTERVMTLVRPVAKRWFRSEVRGWTPFQGGAVAAFAGAANESHALEGRRLSAVDEQVVRWSRTL